MIEQFEDFDGSWPYAPLFTDVSGFNQHYVMRGADTVRWFFAFMESRPGVICIER